VSRVSTKPKATALQLILNWPHSLDVDELAEHLPALGLLGLRRLAPVRGDRADHPEGHDRVDVEHRLELLVRHPVHDPVPGVAGVVDDDVDPSKGLDRGPDQLLGDVGLGQIAGEDRRLAVDLAGRLLGDIAVDVVDQHLRALAHEQLRGRPADPARRAGHDRRLAVKKSHLAPSHRSRSRGTLRESRQHSAAPTNSTRHRARARHKSHELVRSVAAEGKARISIGGLAQTMEGKCVVR
jgi:hypothetical protein